MISLDQVYLLEQKVESAVAKIQQLQAENDALRNKCAELTNALSVKSEQLSSFESDQSQIENGIKKALDRLNSIENAVLRNDQAASIQNQQAKAAAPVQETPAPTPTTKPVESPVQNQPQQTVQTQTPVQPQAAAPSFDSMDTIQSENVPMQDFAPEENIEVDEEPVDTEDDNHDGLGFDIF